MTNTRPLCLALLITLLVTCGGSLTKVSVTQAASTSIPGATLFEQLAGNAVGFSGLGNFDLAQSQEFKNQGIKKEQINSGKKPASTTTVEAKIVLEADINVAGVVCGGSGK